MIVGSTDLQPSSVSGKETVRKILLVEVQISPTWEIMRIFDLLPLGNKEIPTLKHPSHNPRLVRMNIPGNTGCNTGGISDI